MKTLLIASDNSGGLNFPADSILPTAISEYAFKKEVDGLLGFGSQENVRQGIQLTELEVDVLRLICMEHNNEGIAATLGRSKRTIEGIRTRIMKKLGVKSVVGMVKRAIEKGICVV